MDMGMDMDTGFEMDTANLKKIQIQYGKETVYIYIYITILLLESRFYI